MGILGIFFTCSFLVNTRETTCVDARPFSPGVNRSSHHIRRPTSKHVWCERVCGVFHVALCTHVRRATDTRAPSATWWCKWLACQRRSINSWTSSVPSLALLWNSLCDLFQSDWDVHRHFKSLHAATPGLEVRPNTVYLFIFGETPTPVRSSCVGFFFNLGGDPTAPPGSLTLCDLVWMQNFSSPPLASRALGTNTDVYISCII